jgi:hypothetical protein
MSMDPYSAVSSSQSRLPASATNRPRRPAGPSRCSAKPLAFSVAVGHGGELVGGVEVDETSGRRFFVLHLRPATLALDIHIHEAMVQLN